MVLSPIGFLKSLCGAQTGDAILPGADPTQPHLIQKWANEKNKYAWQLVEQTQQTSLLYFLTYVNIHLFSLCGNC